MTVNELAALVGTEGDATTALEALAGIAPRLAPLVTACSPETEDAMWQFLTDVEELHQKFSSGVSRTEMSETKLRLLTVRAGIVDLFDRLGLSTGALEALPANARPTCEDASSVGGLMTWDVRHLANLIGSDNVTDADGYLVEMTALTEALADLVDECEPKAGPTIAAFQDAMDNLVATYQPGSDPAAVAGDKQSMGSLRTAGIALYAKLGLDDTGWRVIPTTEQ